jgi:hypothetical protein
VCNQIPRCIINQVTEQNLNTDKILMEILIGNQLDVILNNPREFPTELIERLSLETALKYSNGQIDYSDGDLIMNHLYSFWVTNDNYCKNSRFGDIAWECFEAFDAGEFYREDDDRNIDPAEKYTRPLIEELLKNRQIL